MTMRARSKPQYRRAKGGGWAFTYETRKLRVVQRITREHADEPWAVYEITDAGEKFLAEGTERGVAAEAAMFEIDLRAPDKPLLNAEHASGFITRVSGAFPSACAFIAVHDAKGVMVGWTFLAEIRTGVTRFGWVTTDRRYATDLSTLRGAAAEGLVEAVAATEGVEVPEVIGGGRSAVVPVRPEPLEGVIVGHTGTAKGSMPRDMDDPVVRAALVALGADPERHHPVALRLAEVGDAYDPQEPDSYEADKAWGALVEPSGSGGGRGRVRVFWLEGGQYDRPYDPGLKVQLQIVADRLTKHGFLIERTGAFAVIAWHVETLNEAAGKVELPDIGEPSDVWTVTGQDGQEIARVIGCDYRTAVREARKVDQVRTLMRITGGASFRRLGTKELTMRWSGYTPR